MRLDNYGELVSEIWPEGNVANLGNCMAETARYYNLYRSLQIGLPPKPVNLTGFATLTTYLQSLDPACPSDWTVSSDQLLPLYIAYDKINPGYAKEMKHRIFKNWFRTPDNNLTSLPFLVLLILPRGILNVVVFLQALSLRIPFSWDQKTATHLNWFQTALLCPLWVRKSMPATSLIAQISQYYSNEPNSGGLLNLYRVAIQKAYQI